MVFPLVFGLNVVVVLCVTAFRDFRVEFRRGLAVRFYGGSVTVVVDVVVVFLSCF